MIALCGPLALLIIAVTIGYWSSAFFFRSRHVIEFWDGLVISCSIMVISVYGKRFWHGLTSGKPDVFDLVISGIAGIALMNTFDRSWRLIARVTGTWWMMDHYVIGYLLSLMALFACFHLVVRGRVTEKSARQAGVVTSEAWGIITVAIVLGMALGSLAIALDIAFLGG